MAWWKVKPNGVGRGGHSERWTSRRYTKEAARRARRRQDKQEAGRT